MTEHQAILSYNNPERAQQYHAKKGFDPARKERMLEVTLRLLTSLAPAQSVLLELGAGTGLFTQQILLANHFAEIRVTDGAPAMLEIARRELTHHMTRLEYDELDFSQPWADRYTGQPFQAVTSSMAVHHVEDKQRLFQEIYSVLTRSGVFVFADHMAGATETVNQMIGYERGRIRLESIGKDPTDSQELSHFYARDRQQQENEGNRCESVAHYLNYLHAVGFQDVDCLWRDYWLAVFVARKS